MHSAENTRRKTRFFKIWWKRFHFFIYDLESAIYLLFFVMFEFWNFIEFKIFIFLYLMLERPFARFYLFLYGKMHFNVLSPLVKAILGKKIIYFSIGSFYGAISVFLSILYVDWLACGLGSLYPGGDKMHTSGHRISRKYIQLNFIAYGSIFSYDIMRQTPHNMAKL